MMKILPFLSPSSVENQVVGEDDMTRFQIIQARQTLRALPDVDKALIKEMKMAVANNQLLLHSELLSRAIIKYHHH